VGLQPNFEIREASVPNAVATIQNNVRLILYNPSFMSEIDKQTNRGDWASMSVLAHEIGHHLQGHTLQGGGSSPEIELEADKFSGFSLAQMGASLEEACAAMKSAMNPGSATHPASDARLVAITAGWKDANELQQRVKQIARKKPPEDPIQQTVRKPVIPDQEPPIPRPMPPQPAQPLIVARIVFIGSPLAFVITGTGQIWSIDPDNQIALFGVQAPPADPNLFAWDIKGPADRMGVAYNGQIWRLLPNGQAIVMGYVTRAN
jgi:hypothetical protein